LREFKELTVMSDRTAPALATLDALLPHLDTLPAGPSRDRIVEEAGSLRRAVAAFHMEAIRFRMYNVERLLQREIQDAESQRLFDTLRQQLEEAGFHTRSHSAP
jgi:hypothetical protein